MTRNEARRKVREFHAAFVGAQDFPEYFSALPRNEQEAIMAVWSDESQKIARRILARDLRPTSVTRVFRSMRRRLGD